MLKTYKNKVVILILIILIFLLLGIYLYNSIEQKKLQNNCSLMLLSGEKTKNQKTAIYQPDSKCWIGTYNNTIYICEKGIKNSFLMRITKDGLEKVALLGKGSSIHTIYGFNDEWLYYSVYNTRYMNDNDHVPLYCFNVISNIEYCVQTTYWSDERHTMLHCYKDYVYIPIDSPYCRSLHYLVVDKNELMGVTEFISDEETIIENTFRVVRDNVSGTDTLVTNIDDDSYISNIIQKKDRVIFCCQYDTHIEFVSKQNKEETCLFSLECCDSQYGIAIHDQYLYLSIRRFSGLGPAKIGYVGFKDDKMEGTYKINILTKSVEKISDKIYLGLYNLDDTCLFACDNNGNIEKLSYEGIVEAVIRYK